MGDEEHYMEQVSRETINTGERIHAVTKST